MQRSKVDRYRMEYVMIFNLIGARYSNTAGCFDDAALVMMVWAVCGGDFHFEMVVLFFYPIMRAVTRNWFFI